MEVQWDSPGSAYFNIDLYNLNIQMGDLRFGLSLPRLVYKVDYISNLHRAVYALFLTEVGRGSINIGIKDFCSCS